MTYHTLDHTTIGPIMTESIWQKVTCDTDRAAIMVALARTPADQEYVEMTIIGKRTANRFRGYGWEPIRDNRFDGGIYRAWVRQTIMRRKRADVDLDTAAWSGIA